MGQNLQNFLTVVGIEEEESGTSMTPYQHPRFWKLNCFFGVFGDMEYIFEWKIAELDRFWHKTECCSKKIAMKKHGKHRAKEKN